MEFQKAEEINPSEAEIAEACSDCQYVSMCGGNPDASAMVISDAARAFAAQDGGC